MKIVVLSDTHYRLSASVEAIKRHSPDLILHAGDMVSDAEELMREFPNTEFINVRGNCDYNSHAPVFELFEKCGKRFFMTHGHLYDVKYGYLKISYAAAEKNADICIFGHSHISYIDKHENTILLNSGSISQPRNTTLGTYALIDIETTKTKVCIYYADGKIYTEREYYDNK